MAEKYTIDQITATSVADALRDRLGTDNLYPSADWAQGILDIPSGSSVVVTTAEASPSNYSLSVTLDHTPVFPFAVFAKIKAMPSSPTNARAWCVSTYFLSDKFAQMQNRSISTNLTGGSLYVAAKAHDNRNKVVGSTVQVSPYPSSYFYDGVFDITVVEGIDIFGLMVT